MALVSCTKSEVEKYAKEKGVEEKEWGKLIYDSTIVEWVQSRINAQTSELAAYEQIKYAAILPTELTQENGELTPTLKVKRKHVMQKYQPLIDGLYNKGKAFQKS